MDLNGFMLQGRAFLSTYFKSNEESYDRSLIGKELAPSHFGNIYETFRRIMGLPKVDCAPSYMHFQDWSWCDWFLAGHQPIWESYITASRSALDAGSTWSQELSNEYRDGAGNLVARYLVEAAKHYETAYILRFPGSQPVQIGHISASIETFSKEHDLNSTDVLAWSIVTDLLYGSMWDSSAGERVASDLNSAVQHAAYRWTMYWQHATSQFRDRHTTDIKLLTNSSWLLAGRDDVQVLMHDTLRKYVIADAVKESSEVERNVASWLAIFDGVIKYIAERVETELGGNLRLIVDAESRSIATCPWEAVAMPKVFGVYIRPSMRTAGNHFVSEFSEQLGRAAISELVSGRLGIPGWADLQDPEPWLRHAEQAIARLEP